MEAIHTPISEASGGPMNIAAALTVAKRKGHMSRGLDRPISSAPAKTTTVTSTLYGKIKIAEKSTLRDYRSHQNLVMQILIWPRIADDRIPLVIDISSLVIPAKAGIVLNGQFIAEGDASLRWHDGIGECRQPPLPLAEEEYGSVSLTKSSLSRSDGEVAARQG